MPIAVKCRECGEQYRVKNAAEGKSFECKECDAKIRVPRSGQKKRSPAKKKKPAADSWEDDPWDDELEERPRRKSRNSSARSTYFSIKEEVWW